MHGIYRFLKSTIFGGLGVLLPVIVLLALVGWAVDTAITAVRPVFEWLPDKSVHGVSLVALAAVGSLVAACFLAGLLAKTAIVRGLGDRAERLALSVPGYALMKNVGASLVGAEGKHSIRTALIRFEVSWQLGFLMETLADGRHVIFVPGVPRALVGTLHLVSADRVQLLTMSVPAALDNLGRLGVGLRDAWKNELVSGTEALMPKSMAQVAEHHAGDPMS
ncbi:MAG: DUF502 domain-containing protein [Gemmataceae bacterium]